jgi:hypothetical protein
MVLAMLKPGHGKSLVHSAIRRPCNPHTGHGIVNHMTEQVIVRKSVRKHPIESIAVGKAVLVFPRAVSSCIQ